MSHNFETAMVDILNKASSYEGTFGPSSVLKDIAQYAGKALQEIRNKNGAVVGPAAQAVVINRPVTDTDVLYNYTCLAAKCRAFGLTLSASRSHIVVRDVKKQVVAMKPTIAEVEKELDYLVAIGDLEHSKVEP